MCIHFELTNQEREYLGLKLVEDSWERVVITEDICVYFDREELKKRILYHGNVYHESDLTHKSTDNRTILLPKAKRGKPRKLTPSAVYYLDAAGTYFSYSGQEYATSVIICNYTTQQTYYSSDSEDLQIKSFDELRAWLRQ